MTPDERQTVIDALNGAVSLATDIESEAADKAWMKLSDALAIMLRERKPVAWAMPRSDGLVLDVICPDEHEAYAGEYSIPLFKD